MYDKIHYKKKKIEKNKIKELHPTALRDFRPVLTLSNAARSSLFCPHLLVAGAGVWSTFLLGVQDTRFQFLGWEDPSGEGHGTPLQYSRLGNLTVGLAGYSPWGGKELDMTNSFSFHQLSVLTLSDFPFPGVGKEMTGVRRRRRRK